MGDDSGCQKGFYNQRGAPEIQALRFGRSAAGGGAAAARAGCAARGAYRSAVGTGAARSAGGAVTGVAAVAGCAARVAVGRGADGVGVAHAARGLREKWKGEEFVAYVFREFLAGRDLTESIGRNHDLHLGQHLQHHGHADGDLELAVALPLAVDADGADEAFDGERHDGLLGNAKDHVFIHLDAGLADPLLAALIHEHHVDRHVHGALHPGVLRPVAKPVDAKIADFALGGGGAAALERPWAARLGQLARVAGIVLQVVDGLLVGDDLVAGVGAGAVAAVAVAGALTAGICIATPGITGAGEHGDDVANLHFLVVQLFLG